MHFTPFALTKLMQLVSKLSPRSVQYLNYETLDSKVIMFCRGAHAHERHRGPTYGTTAGWISKRFF
jgi:hypothetical protein